MSKIDLSTNPLNPVFGMNPIGTRQSKDVQTLLTLFSEKHRIETYERFTWTNLPNTLNSDLIERILYFRGKGALFNFQDKFFFLSFTLASELGIDCYGRYNGITPVLFTGSTQDEEEFFSGLTFKAAYDDTIPIEEKPAIILTSRSLGVSQDLLSESILIWTILERMVNTLVLTEMDLINSAKTLTIRVPDEATKAAVEREFQGIDNKILNGKRIVAIVGSIDIQEMRTESARDSAKYLQTFQAFDNMRKSIIGLDNGGVFLKQEHTTVAESSLHSQSNSLVLNNALRMRKEFCELANHYYGLNIQVECTNSNTPKESVVAQESRQTKQLEDGVENGQ